MRFQSITFLLFLVPFLLCYQAVPARWQNLTLLSGSIVFYLWGNLYSGPILLSVTLVSYFCARAMERMLWGKRTLWLVIGQSFTLGMLILSKFVGLLDRLNLTFLGISFFSFAVSGYLFDVYRSKLAPEHSFIDYAAFVCFFPAILAGPIGMARKFLPQLKAHRPFSLSRYKAGFLRFVVGCVKKMVLADALGILVDAAYAQPESFSGGVWILVTVVYAFQIYIDFSAYSDMAIGMGQVLGFSLTENFSHPYFSRSVKEFWKGWHISLTSWFREYLYFPLGGSRCSAWKCRRNILIVFAVSGLWHGSAGHYVVWGLLNGVYQVVGQITDPLRSQCRKRLHIREDHPLLIAWQFALTFGLVALSWVFFRAESCMEAVFILKRMALILRDGLGVLDVYALGMRKKQLLATAIMVCGFVLWELYRFLRPKESRLHERVLPYWCAMTALLLVLSFLGVYGPGFNPQDFVYFRF